MMLDDRPAMIARTHRLAMAAAAQAAARPTSPATASGPLQPCELARLDGIDSRVIAALNRLVCALARQPIAAAIARPRSAPQGCRRERVTRPLWQAGAE